MSIAPLHGRPAPLLFVRKSEIRWPRNPATEGRGAPLSTRARRLRRRRLGTLVLVIAAILVAIGGLAWMMLKMRG